MSCKCNVNVMYLTHGNIIFDILESHAFKNIAHVWSFKHFGFVYLLCKVCARCVQGVRTMCARCVQDVCKMCARCAQDVCKVCSIYVILTNTGSERHFRKRGTAVFLLRRFVELASDIGRNIPTKHYLIL